MKTSTLKKVLLAGTAIVAVGVFSPAARAADTEAAGAAGTPTDMLAGFTSGSNLNNIADDANDFGAINVDNGVTAGAINSDFTGGLAVYDGTDDTAGGDTLTVGHADIATGSTLTLLFGGSIADGSGADGLEEANLVISGDLAEANGSTRGGTLAVLGAANNATGPGILSVNGDTLMTAVSVTGGAGGAANAGTAVTATFGNSSHDDFDVTGFSVIGGAANAADTAGGAASATVNGDATVGTGNLVVTGGAGADNALGGAASATFNDGLTVTGAGTITITGGAAAAGGVGTSDGGAATMIVDGDLTVGTGTLTVIGGADAAGSGGDTALTVTGDVVSGGALSVSTGTGGGGGVNGDALVNFGGDVTFTSIGLNTGADGAAKITFNGTGSQDVHGAIDGVGGAEGALVIANDHGVTFHDTVGGTNGIATVLVSKTGGDSKAIFTNTVKAAITLGDGVGSGTNTLGFDTSDHNFTVTGTVNGTANDIDNVVIGGGGTLTAASAWGGVSPLQSVTLQKNTQLVAQNSINGTAFNLSSGSEINTTGASTLTGNINGNGTLDVDANTSVVGNIGNSNDLTAIEVAAGSVLTVDAATAAADLTVDAGSFTLQGVGAGLTVTAGTHNVTVDPALHTTLDSEGVVTITDGADDDNIIQFNHDLGESTTLSLDSLVFANAGNNIDTVRTYGNLFVDAITIDGSDVLNIRGHNVTVSGTIDGNGADSEGQVVVGDGSSSTNATFSSALGATKTLDLFQVTAGSTANVSHDISTDGTAAGINIDGTLAVDTTGGAVTISDATAAVDSDGTIIVTGANDFTLSGATDVAIDGTFASLTTVANKVANITAGTGDIVFGGTGNTIIGTGNELVLTAGDDLLVGGNATDHVDILFGRTATYNPAGGIVIDATGLAGAVNIDSDTVVNVGLVDTSKAQYADGFVSGLEDGDSITVIDGGAAVELDGAGTDYGTLITDGNIVLRDTGLIDFVNNGSTTDDLIIKANFRDASDVLDQSTAGQAQSLMDFATATDELAQARSNLLSAPTAEAAHEVAESLGPTVDGANLVAAQVFSGQVANITSARLADLRTGNETGMAAGDMGHGTSWWVQGFGTRGNQDARDGVDGFDVDNYGVSIGADTQNLATNAVLGAALSYAKTNVDSDNANSTDTDIDSFQIALYGDYDLDQRTYVSGQVGYAWSDIDTTRHNVGGISGLTANGGTNANQFQARAEVGRDFAGGGNMTVTPKALADYTWYDADDYRETGAGNADLNVSQDSQNVFNVGVGVDAAWLAKHNDGSSLEPALHAAVRYDLVGDDVVTTNSFVGGGSSFVAKGFDAQRTTVDLGADVTFHATTNWDLKAGYNYEWKDDYDSHSGVVRASYKF